MLNRDTFSYKIIPSIFYTIEKKNLNWINSAGRKSF